MILVACILESTVLFLDATVVNVALPSFQRDLGGGLALQQCLVDTCLLTLGSLILFGGSVGDLFWSRSVLVMGLVGLAGPVLALIEAPSRGFGDPLTLGCLLGGGGLLAAFVAWKVRVAVGDAAAAHVRSPELRRRAARELTVSAGSRRSPCSFSSFSSSAATPRVGAASRRSPSPW